MVSDARINALLTEAAEKLQFNVATMEDADIKKLYAWIRTRYLTRRGGITAEEIEAVKKEFEPWLKD